MTHQSQRIPQNCTKHFQQIKNISHYLAKPLYLDRFKNYHIMIVQQNWIITLSCSPIYRWKLSVVQRALQSLFGWKQIVHVLVHFIQLPYQLRTTVSYNQFFIPNRKYWRTLLQDNTGPGAHLKLNPLILWIVSGTSDCHILVCGDMITVEWLCVIIIR